VLTLFNLKGWTPLCHLLNKYERYGKRIAFSQF
jgi:hypothetical protein